MNKDPHFPQHEDDPRLLSTDYFDPASNVREFDVKVEYSCEVDTPEEAVAQFCEWLCSGRRSVTVTEHGVSTTHEVEMGWVE